MAAIPLYSVTPCMCFQVIIKHDNLWQAYHLCTQDLYNRCVCFQVWDEDDQRSRRSLSCPFNPSKWSLLSSLYCLYSTVSSDFTRWGWPVYHWNADVSYVSIPETFQGNVWQNVSMSVDPDLMNNHRSMLRWNLSAPCRLEGEVWPCHEQGSCREVHGFRQQLTNSTWRQNSKGHWVKNKAKL